MRRKERTFGAPTEKRRLTSVVARGTTAVLQRLALARGGDTPPPATSKIDSSTSQFELPKGLRICQIRSLGTTLVVNSCALARRQRRANYGEAQSAESQKDFVHKMKVALKELRETLIWFVSSSAKNCATPRDCKISLPNAMS